MIYKDWSSEIGCTLERITGIESNFYREYFEYVKEIYKPEKILFISEEQFLLPVVVTTTGVAYVLGDIDLLHSGSLLKQKISGLEAYGFEVIDNARQEYVIQLQDSFNANLKSLERVGRCYSKCSKFTSNIYNDIVLKDEHEGFYDKYLEYWKNRGEITPSFSIFRGCLLQMSHLSKTYTIEINHNDTLLALGYFIVYDGELRWYETLRTLDESYSKYSVGNYILLVAMRDICYKFGYNLNLGVSWFDYKKHWHPVLKDIRGISIIG